MSNIDPIDKMLQGDDTTPASQAETGQQDDSIEPIEQQTEEEVEFSKLSGSAQERVRELVRRAKDAEERASMAQTYVPPAPNTLAPDQKQAIETLSGFGISTDDKVDQKIAEGVNQVRWELRNTNLQQKYSGANGEPKYDPVEVEDYIRSHSQYRYYDPEDVFKFKMFPDEFSNAETVEQTSKPRTTSLRPTKAQTRQDALTPEYIEERLKQPDADEWYTANLDEINKVVTNHTNQFKGTNFGGQ